MSHHSTADKLNLWWIKTFPSPPVIRAPHFPCTFELKVQPHNAARETLSALPWHLSGANKLCFVGEWHQITATSRHNKHHMTLNIILFIRQRFMGLSRLAAAGPPDPEHASETRWNYPGRLNKSVCVSMPEQSYHKPTNSKDKQNESLVEEPLRLQCVSLTRVSPKLCSDLNATPPRC